MRKLCFSYYIKFLSEKLFLWYIILIIENVMAKLTTSYLLKSIYLSIHHLNLRSEDPLSGEVYGESRVK